MKLNFLKFKAKSARIGTISAVLAGASAGLAAFGISLLLSKLALLDFEPIISLPIGALVALIVGAVLFFVFKKSDRRLAMELDRIFGLNEKVQTMVQYEEDNSEMLELQRQDAESSLAIVGVKAYKPGRLWMYFVAFILGAALTVTSVVVENRRDYVPPEEVIPFELSAMKERGLEELIKYVEESEMEELYRASVADTLKKLLADLKVTKTEPEMKAHLSEAMALILLTTYDSSSSAEILDALWDSGDKLVRELARTLDTSEWSEPDWGDYADKLAAFKTQIIGSAEADSSDEGILWRLDSLSLKVGLALPKSGIQTDDAIYSALIKLVSDGEYVADGQRFHGLTGVVKKGSGLSNEELLAMIEATFTGMSNEIFSAIEQKKINTNVGEYALTKLSTLFLVPLPEFERPAFVKNGADGNGGSDSGGKDEEENGGGSSGGVGMGSVYGSDDLVLNPLTGEYVKYGELLDAYFAVMEAKISEGNYTELQKEAIRKYFALLYGGMKKD